MSTTCSPMAEPTSWSGRTVYHKCPLRSCCSTCHPLVDSRDGLLDYHVLQIDFHALQKRVGNFVHRGAVECGVLELGVME